MATLGQRLLRGWHDRCIAQVVYSCPQEDHQVQKRLLIIEDEQVLRVGIQRFLSRRGYQVAMAADGGTGLRMLENASYEMVVVDLGLPDIDGTLLTRHIRSIAPSTLIMIISAAGDLHEILHLFRTGIYDYLAKPFLFSSLEKRIQFALSAGSRPHRMITQRVEWQREEPLENWLIGQGDQLKATLGELHWATLGVRPVLIIGESGTGKQQVVRLLQQWSDNPVSALHNLDAGKLNDAEADLRLSEFYEQQLGAETNAGVPATTLIVENFQALSTELRNRLYHQLASAQQQTKQKAWQLIATISYASDNAATRDALLQQLRFPKDAFVIHLPALRDHMEDLPFIADLLLTQARQQMHKPVFGLDTQAMRCLLGHNWPGNIGELQEVIEQAVKKSDSIRLGVQDLPAYLQHSLQTTVAAGKLH